MQLHAAVLGLQAAAATAPYHVPDWLPDLLCALLLPLCLGRQGRFLYHGCLLL